MVRYIMDFSKYLSSHAKTKIIQELCSNPEVWWSIGEIIRFSGLSNSSAQKALEILKREKVLLSRRVSNRHEFRFNIDSFPGSELAKLFGLYRKLQAPPKQTNKLEYICDFNDGIRNLYQNSFIIKNAN